MLGLGYFNKQIIRYQLYNYGKNLFIFSTAGQMINYPSGDVIMDQNLFKFNYATNSIDTIINVFAKAILMNSIKFINNSVYAIDQLLNNNVHSFNIDEIVRVNKVHLSINQSNGKFISLGGSYIIKNCQVENLV
ncbi:unnamed protein product [Paramecium primaurelia]|uniref:Uncharacterized protein n=1 Tax=Paramecium primaurelia TaxID=5886 RepID=A0A8S1LKI4_PARPR|nr:unnamed protein product [Paramecium primaurelia]